MAYHINRSEAGSSAEEFWERPHYESGVDISLEELNVGSSANDGV